MGHVGAAAAVARVEIDRHLACAALEGLAEDQRPPREVRLLGETANGPAFASDLLVRAVDAATGSRLAPAEQPTGTADVHAERLRGRYCRFSELPRADSTRLSLEETTTDLP